MATTYNTESGVGLMTAEEMYELLTDENKEIVNRQIEILVASQLESLPLPGFPD